MAQPKGKTGNPNGRPKGAVGKTTQAAREAIAMFVDGNAHRLEEWLDRVAETEPAEAFKLFQSVIEYHVPKLARTETRHEGQVGLTVNIQYPDASKPTA